MLSNKQRMAEQCVCELSKRDCELQTQNGMAKNGYMSDVLMTFTLCHFS